MKLSALIPAAKFAESAFAAAGLDLEAALAAGNVNLLKDAIGSATLTEEKLAHFEAMEADHMALKDLHATATDRIDQLTTESAARQTALDELEAAVTAMRDEHQSINAAQAQLTATLADLKIPAAALSDPQAIATALSTRASREAAEIMARVGQPPVAAHVPPVVDAARARAGQSDEAIYETYKGLTGKERADYYAANTDAIWRAKNAQD